MDKIIAALGVVAGPKSDGIKGARLAGGIQRIGLVRDLTETNERNLTVNFEAGLMTQNNSSRTEKGRYTVLVNIKVDNLYDIQNKVFFHEDWDGLE